MQLMPGWRALLLVAAGGAAGSICRYFLGGLIARRFGSWFPFATITINVTGSFLIGVAVSMLLVHRTPGAEALRLALCVGFLGGYTTFSTFEMETYSLVTSGRAWFALSNVLLSVIAGFCAVCAGMFVGSALK